MNRRNFLKGTLPVAGALAAVCGGTRVSRAKVAPRLTYGEQLNDAIKKEYPHNITSPFGPDDRLYHEVINTPDGRQYVTYSTGFKEEADNAMLNHQWIALPTVKAKANEWKMWYSSIMVSLEELYLGKGTRLKPAGGAFMFSDIFRRAGYGAQLHERTPMQSVENARRSLVYNVTERIESW
jgi:hypothetical protein